MRSGRSHARRVAFAVIGLAISGLFLYLTLRRTDLAGVADALATVSLPVLSLALVTRGCAFLALGLRSRATVAPAKQVAYKDLMLSHLLGFTGNNVLPFRLGELLRIDYLARKADLSRSFLVGTVAVERLLDSVTLLVLFALAAPVVLGRSSLAGSFQALTVATGLAVVAATAAARWRIMPAMLSRVLAPLSPHLATAVADKAALVEDGLSSISSARWAPQALGATALYWFSMMVSIRVVIAAFSLELPWYAPVPILAITALGTALPSAPGFVGTYHYFSALAVSMLGADPATAASFAIVAHATGVVPYTSVGLVVFARSIRVWTRGGEERTPRPHDA